MWIRWIRIRIRNTAYEEPIKAFGSSYLNGGRSPGYEVGQLALSDPLEALVHLGWVHLTLHNNNLEH
jgi:hypothetical protein